MAEGSAQVGMGELCGLKRACVGAAFVLAALLGSLFASPAAARSGVGLNLATWDYFSPDFPLVDQAKLDYVVREAVASLARRPDDATQVSVSIDDGRVSRTYRSGTGRVTILEEWWLLLAPASTAGRAFSVDLTPSDATVGTYGVDYVWVSTTETGPVL